MKYEIRLRSLRSRQAEELYYLERDIKARIRRQFEILALMIDVKADFASEKFNH